MFLWKSISMSANVCPHFCCPTTRVQLLTAAGAVLFTIRTNTVDLKCAHSMRRKKTTTIIAFKNRDRDGQKKDGERIWLPIHSSGESRRIKTKKKTIISSNLWWPASCVCVYIPILCGHFLAISCLLSPEERENQICLFCSCFFCIHLTAP